LKKLLFILFFFVGITNCFSQKVIKLRTGDILFQVGNGSDFEKAVINSTRNYSTLTFSHCGVVAIENDTIFVLEASSQKGVTKTIYADFYNESIEIIVGRLKPKYRNCISQIIQNLYMLIGMKYDFIFAINNDDYYCSELLQVCFKDKKGQHIFETVPMNFKDALTGEYLPYWTDYFNERNSTIPQGKEGSNPTQLSKSKNIRLIGSVKNL
jgi:hypothetical protein